MKTWIAADEHGSWHLAEQQQDGDRTIYLTACGGRQLGGPGGFIRQRGCTPPRSLCKKCQALLNEKGAN